MQKEVRRANKTMITRSSFNKGCASMNAMVVVLIIAICCCVVANAFVTQPRRRIASSSSIMASNADYAFLQERVREMRLSCIEKDIQRPPNPQLSAQEFCVSLLDCLQSPDDPWPDAGFRILLRCSTTNWKTALYKSVGARFPEASAESVASALSTHMSNEKNQFQLLVQPTVKAEFPTDACDFMDGTCWVECQLRSSHGFLLAIVGFSLVKERGAWMLDDMDWMDLRKQPMFR